METDMLKTIELTLTDLDARAIRSFIQWMKMAEEQGKLEIFDYQRDTLNKLKKVIGDDAN
jgi:hypothetical protein